MAGDFVNFLKNAVNSKEVKKAISGATDQAISDASSFGFGIVFAFLGEYIVRKRPDSKKARFIASILGADVKKINRDFILKKIIDKNYYSEFKNTIYTTLQTGSINDFAKFLGLEESEAWDIFIEIKNVILDNELFAKIAEISNSVSQFSNVKTEFDKIGKNLTDYLDATKGQLETLFLKELTDLQLTSAGIKLITPFDEYGKGDLECWKEGIFSNNDIKNDYDARRKDTDQIIESTKNYSGTIIFAKPGYGKTMMLKRVMFEMIGEGYSVIYCENIKANHMTLYKLIEKISKKIPKLLIIVDNVHDRGNSVILEAFEEISPLISSHFLFAARKKELDKLQNSVDHDKAGIFKRVLKKINVIDLVFSKEDAINFVKQAILISKKKIIDKKNLIKIIESSGKDIEDPLMFSYIIRYYLLEEIQAASEFLLRDFNEKFPEEFHNDKKIRHAAIFCSILATFGITITRDLAERCKIDDESLERLSDTHFLFKSDELSLRHERWALEFLLYLYKNKMNFNYTQLDKKYDIKNIFSCILNNNFIDNLYTILNRSAVFFVDKRYERLAETMLDLFFIPESVNDQKRAEILCYGLGAAFGFISLHEKALTFFNQALEIKPDFDDALHNKGVALGKLDRHQEALDSFEKALEIEPKNVGALYNKGIVLGKLGKNQEALDSFEKALEIEPKNVGALYNKGIVLGKLGKNQEALDSFEKALEIEPKNVNTLYNKGVALDELDRHQEALDSYEKALEIEPKNVNTLYNKGAALDELGKNQEALDSFEKALEIEPKNVGALYNKGIVLGKLGKNQEALDSFEKALEIEPKNVGALYNKGIVLGKLGKNQEALDSFEKALEIEPKNVSALYRKGVALDELDRHQEALDSFEKALEIEPKNVNTLYSKGVALGKLGKNQEALDSFEKALEIEPKNVDTLYNKGVALGKLGKNQEALDSFEKALEIEPKDVDTLYSKGVALGKLGKNQEALDSFEKALEIEPKNVSALYRKGIVLGELGKNQEALDSFEKALEIEPKNINTLYNKGVSLGKLGKNQEALDSFEKALEIEPKNASALQGKGTALSFLKKYEEAISCFDSILEIDPQNMMSFYGKARINAIQGNTNESISLLEKAIKLNSMAINIAKTDDAFTKLTKNARFKKLVDLNS